jgi:hypothetical protein
MKFTRSNFAPLAAREAVETGLAGWGGRIRTSASGNLHPAGFNAVGSAPTAGTSAQDLPLLGRTITVSPIGHAS